VPGRGWAWAWKFGMEEFANIGYMEIVDSAEDILWLVKWYSR